LGRQEGSPSPRPRGNRHRQVINRSALDGFAIIQDYNKDEHKVNFRWCFQWNLPRIPIASAVDCSVAPTEYTGTSPIESLIDGDRPRGFAQATFDFSTGTIAPSITTPMFLPSKASTTAGRWASPQNIRTPFPG
jgi:hypothetical protein